MFISSIEYFLLVPINNLQRQIQRHSTQNQVPINQCNILLAERSTLPNANFCSLINTDLQNQKDFCNDNETKTNFLHHKNKNLIGETSSNCSKKTDLSTFSHQPSTSSAVNNDSVLHNYESSNLITHGVYKNFNTNITNKRLLFELEQLENLPIAGCQIQPFENTILKWTAVIEGPQDTVYEGGTFFLNLIFNSNYPFVAPKIVFLTRIYHCNINSQGKVCMEPITKNWNSCMTISTILQALISLLYACNPNDALVPSIANQFLKNPKEYEKMARIWTRRYAQ